MLPSYTALDGGSDRLRYFRWRAAERMIAAIAISDSDTDSEFEQDIQEATRRLLMTVAPSPVKEVVFDNDDDE